MIYWITSVILWGKRKPRPPIPVRVPGRIVTIRASQAAIAAVIQVAEAPRRTDTRRLVEIEGRAYHARIASAIRNIVKRGALPLWAVKPPIHPAFCRFQKAEAAHSSTRTRANSYHTRQPSRQCRRYSSRRSAKAHGHQTTRRNRRPI